MNQTTIDIHRYVSVWRQDGGGRQTGIFGEKIWILVVGLKLGHYMSEAL